MPLTKVNTAMVSSGGGDIATNTALGGSSLNANTTGANNTAVGNQAGFSNTTGANNVMIGQGAGYTGTTGLSGCVFIGQNAGYTSNGAANTCVGQSTGYSLTTGYRNTFVGVSNQVTGAAGGLITTGNNNTIIGGYTGNQGGLDIRTASSYIVLSDGDGNPELIMGGGYNALTNQQIITSNTKGGTVNILSRAQIFPADNTITSAILLVTAVASEGTSGAYTRSDVIFVSKRFGNQISATNIGSSDGISLSNWTYGYDGSNFRVTQNWGAGGSTLGTRWSILVVSGANVG